MTALPADDAGRIGTRVARASAALLGRQLIVFGLGLVGGVLLARRLPPQVFGAYVVSTTVFAFLSLAGDLGLAASLVQQKGSPSRDEIRSVFSVQVLLGLVLGGTLAVFGPLVAHSSGAPSGVDALTLYVAVAVGITAVRSVLTAQLERALRFTSLGVINALEALAFNATAVALAWAGLGIRSFGIALLSEAALGLALTALVAGGLPLPTVHPSGIRQRLGFGLPFLGSALVSVLKDAVSPLFIGYFLGARDVGLVEWAVVLAAYPLLAVMALQRVFLPAFARLQADRERLARAVEGVLYATNVFSLPVAVITLVLADDLTPVVFGVKWVPGLEVFYLLWIANIGVPTAAPLAGLLNAVGASKVVFRYSVFWMVATWTLTVPLVLGFGRLGFGLANLVVQLSAIPFVRSARRLVPFRVVATVWRCWATAAVLAVSLKLLTDYVQPTSILALAWLAIAGAAAYMVLVALTQKGSVRVLVETLRGAQS